MASRLERATANVAEHYAHQHHAMEEVFQSVKDYFRPMVNRALETTAHLYSMANNRARDIVKLAVVGTAAYLTYQYTPDVVLRIPYLMCLIPDSLIYLPNLTTLYATKKAAEYAFSRELYQNPAGEIDRIIKSYELLLTADELLVNKEGNQVSVEYFEKLTNIVVSDDARKLFNWSTIRGENRRVFTRFLRSLQIDKDAAVGNVCNISPETKSAAEAVITKLFALKSKRAGIRTNAYQKTDHHPHLNRIVGSLYRINDALINNSGFSSVHKELESALDMFAQNFDTVVTKAKDAKKIQTSLEEFQERLAEYSSTSKVLRNKLPSSVRKEDLIHSMTKILKAISPHLSDTSSEKALVEELLDKDLQACKALTKATEKSVDHDVFAKECLKHYSSAETVSSEEKAFAMQKLDSIDEGFKKAFFVQLAKDHKTTKGATTDRARVSWSKSNLFKLDWDKVKKSFETALNSI
ncbi:MAG: hypothetical protein S4CHLAM37_08450 [Chlamydiia bacterium]|nr:hypothetical protein [Chlamydiia bacterium]